MDSDQWYYLSPFHKKKGPITRQRLFVLYLKESIFPSTLVWSSGMEKWEPFSAKFHGIAPPKPVPVPIDDGSDTGTENHVPPQFPLRGRVGRGTFWAWFLLLQGFELIAALIIYKGGRFHPSLINGYLLDERPFIVLGVSLVIALIFLWPGISVLVRRCHDLGMSGWWAVVTLIPWIGWLALIVAGGFVPGAPGTNRYGPPPSSD